MLHWLSVGRPLPGRPAGNLGPCASGGLLLLRLESRDSVNERCRQSVTSRDRHHGGARTGSCPGRRWRRTTPCPAEGPGMRRAGGCSAASAHQLYAKPLAGGSFRLRPVSRAQAHIGSEIGEHCSDTERARQLDGIVSPEGIQE